MPSLSPALRKAAILISSLDARSADALLDQMEEAAARRVRDAVMWLDDIEPQEQERIIGEFLTGNETSAPFQATNYSGDGVELIFSGAGAESPATANKSPALATPPFEFLKEAAADVVARQLLREHPQTAAVVLAHLPPQRAADIASAMPPDVRSDVLRRIGDIDETDADIVREIERGLESVLRYELLASKKQGAGIHTLTAILGALDKNRGNLMPDSSPAAEEVHEPPPVAPRKPNENNVFAPPVNRLPRAETLPARKVEFHELALLDNRAWARVLSAADTQVALLALAGAPPEFVNRLLAQLPPRDAKLLAQRMEQVGPVRLRDIEHAQARLARIAGQLAARGEINLPKPKEFATPA
jgi:flagellar motor switch protein FliG